MKIKMEVGYKHPRRPDSIVIARTGNMSYDVILRQSLRNQAKIKAQTHEIMEEIRDLDEITVEKDISNITRSQVKELCDFDKGLIKSVRTVYGQGYQGEAEH